MPRRLNQLPGADELFGGRDKSVVVDDSSSSSASYRAQLDDDSRLVKASKRTKHDEKITVYLSSEDLMAIEQSRLTLKARYGIKVDRGRLMREAAAMMVQDLQECEEHSMIVQRLQGDEC